MNSSRSANTADDTAAAVCPFSRISLADIKPDIRALTAKEIQDAICSPPVGSFIEYSMRAAIRNTIKAVTILAVMHIPAVLSTDGAGLCFRFFIKKASE